MPGGGGERPVTNLVKNGENFLSYRAVKRGETGPVLPLEIRIMVRPSAGSQKPAETPVEVVVIHETVGDTAEGKVRFSASVPVRWSWQDAPVVTKLVERDEEAIISELQRLSSALESQDWNAYAAILSISLDEGAYYTGIPRSELLQEEIDRIQRAFPDRRFIVQMREKDEILIEPHGRVVLVTGGTEGLGAETWVIRLKPVDDSRSALTFAEFLFCNVDGHWRIVN
jgi:hypothetical protein